MQHRVSVKAKLGATPLDAAFTLSAPWTVLFGPSGCGKTSLLRAMGGVLRGADVSFARCEEGARLSVAGLCAAGWGDLSAPDCR